MKNLRLFIINRCLKKKSENIINTVKTSSDLSFGVLVGGAGFLASKETAGSPKIGIPPFGHVANRIDATFFGISSGLHELKSLKKARLRVLSILKR